MPTSSATTASRSGPTSTPMRGSACSRPTSSLTRALDAELEAQHGLSLSAVEVLGRLAAAPDRRLRLSTLAGETGLSLSRISRIVDTLEAARAVRTALVPRRRTRGGSASDRRRARADPRRPGARTSRRCRSASSITSARPRSRRSPPSSPASPRARRRAATQASSRPPSGRPAPRLAGPAWARRQMLASTKLLAQQLSAILLALAMFSTL